MKSVSKKPCSLFVGKYHRYPDLTGRRKGEGGLRLRGVTRESRDGSPLVTILTVCWNSVKTIETTIKSVIRQGYGNIEYVLVDAASTDGTLDVIKKYVDQIDYFVSEPDRGLYHAMNKGLELASGDYILVLNSDDWYREDCVETLVHARDHSSAHFVSALAQYVDGAGNPRHVLRHMPFDESCRLRMPLRHETMLVSRDIYNAVGPYEESFRIIADFHLTRRIFDAGYTLFEVQEPLLFFRMEGVSHTNRNGLFQERVEVVKERFPFLLRADAEKFAELTKLTPEQLDQLLRSYPDDADFHDTIYRYYVDRCNVATGWRGRPTKDLFKQDKRPLVSVVVAVYNAQNTLRPCIDSVLAQTFQQFEIICVNDQSPDASQAIIDEYAQLDSRVRALINTRNIGLGATRNRGVRAARGDFVFHLDPDDKLPPESLEKLYTAATKHGSELVRGAYQSEQVVHGEGGVKTRRSLCAKEGPLFNTNLREFPKLLSTTEGHWAFLYHSDLARRIPYPSDLRMGQDSIYLTNVLINAKKITVIDDLVYHYCVNDKSAMNTFDFQKYKDAIEWRRRAYVALSRAGYPGHAERLLKRYWGEIFFKTLVQKVTAVEFVEFAEHFQRAFKSSGDDAIPDELPPFLKNVFTLLLLGRFADAFSSMDGPVGLHGEVERLESMRNKTSGQHGPKESGSSTGSGERVALDRIRVATISTLDAGGAGIGSQRRVAALRKNGVDAHIYSLITKTDHSYVHKIVPRDCDANEKPLKNAGAPNRWRQVAEKLIKPVETLPGFRARELFTLADSIISFNDMKDAFDQADIVHLHWVVGMFDYDHTELLDAKPIVWTFADLNPITGGCHYSEGCDEYKRECENCPLLGGNTDLAHKQWLKKKEAYSKLKNLQIICPSKWIAERVAESSLLGDRPLYYVPNAYPTDVFKPTNKTVARIRNGLPLDKKLLIFGADSLENKRKGGDLLKQALDYLEPGGGVKDIEVITFGGSSLELPAKTHNMGRVVDPTQLACIYSAADAFVFSSREDNAPLTVGEAMLSGTPVVAFPVGNVPDLVDHKKNGYLATAFDARSLAEGINWALDCTNRSECLKRQLNSRIVAANYHNPDVAAQRHLEIYYRSVKPTIHIVTPVFNMVDSIDRTIESVVGQAGSFLIRYHVQDGGSTDGTLDRLQAWQDKLHRAGNSGVEFTWATGGDSGMYDAILKGIDIVAPSDYDFVGWINADDLLMPSAFSKVVAIARRRRDVEWIGSHTYNLNPAGEINCSRQNPTPTEVIRAGLCDGSRRHWYHIQQEGTFFRKSLWDKCKHILKKYRYAGDWALWREFAMNAEYYQCDTPLGAFCIREGQLSSALREKYDQEIESSVSTLARDNAFRELFEQRRNLSAKVVSVSSDNTVSIRNEKKFVRDTFYEANKSYSN